MNSTRNVNQVVNDINNGILPVELMFVKNEDEGLDLSKLQYNTFYRTPQYYDSLLPQCLKQLPGYEKMVEKMMEDNQNLTLSQAMDLRKQNKDEELKNKLLEDEVKELFDELNNIKIETE